VTPEERDALLAAGNLGVPGTPEETPAPTAEAGTEASPSAPPEKVSGSYEGNHPEPAAPETKNPPPAFPPRDQFDADTGAPPQLDRYAPVLHTEQNPDTAQRLLDQRSAGLSPNESLWLSNNPDMATGQGTNRGVRMEFDSKGLRGVLNTSKPGWEFQYDQGTAEFSDGAPREADYQRNLRRITVDPKEFQPGEGKRLMNVVLPQLERRGYVRTENADGAITLTRPDLVGSQSAPPPTVSAQAAEPAPPAARGTPNAELPDPLTEPPRDKRPPTTRRRQPTKDTVRPPSPAGQARSQGIHRRRHQAPKLVQHYDELHADQQAADEQNLETASGGQLTRVHVL
jgi:hypothetical protein